MIGTHVIQISVTPDQMEDLIRNVMLEVLANHTPPKPKHPDLPEYLTRKDVAGLLRLSMVTIDNWSRDTDDRKKILNPIKLERGQVRYRREDVLATLDERDELVNRRKW